MLLLRQKPLFHGKGVTPVLFAGSAALLLFLTATYSAPLGKMLRNL
jgi:hypothetical protein